ncbi:MAG: hypothetical protein COS94_01625 [Candidatus Hydrogenedentes bacterium CG07_land_8_20_14_0_80_42_17]|nr:MAG: hypothetical protein COS94_01625 [Candidatus Hydrogenedentes bacterium CG07_land_8_20_14_0_80_42_17]
MECKNFKKNISNCNCTYEPCSRKGTCCECISYHRQNNELPACYFSKSEEATYNRSIAFFLKSRR